MSTIIPISSLKPCLKQPTPPGIATPVPTTPSPISVQWKTDLQNIQEFKRVNSEYWAFFHHLCPYFPELRSEQEAKALLRSFHHDPDIAPFIPLSSKISCSQALSILYQRVMIAPMDSSTLSYCSSYFIQKIQNNPSQFLELAFAALYDCSELQPILMKHIPPFNCSTLQQIMQECRNQGKFSFFVSTLLPLFSLKEIATLRLTIDFVRIAGKLNLLVPEDKKIPISSSSTNGEYLLTLREWLLAQKETLQAIDTLDLSPLGIQRIPPEILPYLSGVKTLRLCEQGALQSPHLLLIDALRLPRLQQLYFSSNQLNDVSCPPLLRAIENAKTLRVLDLSQNAFAFDTAQDLIKTCKKNKINLLLNAFSQQDQDRTQVCVRLNLPPPLASLSPPSFQEKVRLVLEDHKAALSQIQLLDLSQTFLQEFPEEFLPYLSGVKAVNASQNALQQPSLIKTLLKLPHLETLTLSNNSLDLEGIKQLLEILQTTSPLALKKLDLSLNPFDLKQVPALFRFCKENNIALFCSLTAEQSDFISFCKQVIPSLSSLPTSFKTLKQLQETSLKLSTSQKSLQAIASLNLSQPPFELTTFPKELPPLLPNLTTVIFCNRQDLSTPQKMQMLQNIVCLQRLETLDLSGNYFTKQDIPLLLEHLQKAPHLKQLFLLNNNFSQGPEMDALKAFCQERGIALTCFCYTPFISCTLSLLQRMQVSPPQVFVDEEDFLSQALASLELQKNRVRLKALNLSHSPTEAFPSLFLPYLAEVESVDLSFCQGPQNTRFQALSHLLKLPMLTTLNLSGNHITKSTIATLSALVCDPHKTLQEIDLSDCTYFSLPHLTQLKELCAMHQVKLFGLPNQEAQDFTKVLGIINLYLPPSSQIRIPTKYLDFNDYLAQVLPSLQEQADALAQIDTLVLSQLELTTFPERLIPYLPNITHVQMMDLYRAVPKQINVVRSALKFPKLRSIDLSANLFGNPQPLFQCLEQAQNLQSIDLSYTDINLGNLSDSFVEHCNRQGICYKL